MSIVTISRESYGDGINIAESLAKKLGYRCFSRETLLNETAEHYSLEKLNLIRAVEDPSSIFDRMMLGKEKYTAYMSAVFLKIIKEDNVVYHGLSGHFFIKNVPHILKVRILSNMKRRARLAVDLENVSQEKALNIIKKIDAAQRKWGQYLYGIDTSDPDVFDMVLKVDNMNAEAVIEIIASSAQLPCFHATSRSKKMIEDLFMDAQVRACLIEKFPTTRYVSVKNGEVSVIIEGTLKDKIKMTTVVESLLMGIEGVVSTDVRFKH